MPQDGLIQRLWIRVCIYVTLTCLAFGLMLISDGGWGVAIPLLLGAWGLCRAAYLIVRLSEFSTNPESLSARFLYFLRRIIVGSEFDANNLTTYCGDPKYVDGPPFRAIIHLLLMFFGCAVASLLLVPPLYDMFLRQTMPGAWDVFLFPAWLSWLVTCTATCILFGALFEQPFKYRVPISGGALFGLAMGLLLGIRFVDARANNSDFWVILLYAVATYLLGFTVLWLYRWKWSWTLGMSRPAHSSRSSGGTPAQNQVSVRYLIAKMTAVAFAIAMVKLLFPTGFNLPASTDFFPRIFLMMIVGTVMIVALSWVTISLLHVTLGHPAKQTKWYVAWIAILTTISPYALIVGTFWLEGSLRPPSQDEFLAMYVFFLSYAAILSCILLALANAGLCLRRVPVCNESESVP